MAESMENPKPFLKSLTGQMVVVKLKWGMEYKGERSSEANCSQRLFRPALPGSKPHTAPSLPSPLAGKLESVDQYFNVQVSASCSRSPRAAACSSPGWLLPSASRLAAGAASPCPTTVAPRACVWRPSQLLETEEWVGGVKEGDLGEVLIR